MTLNREIITTLSDAFPCLINNEFLSDVKFQFADGQIIFAHSFIMCLRSDDFYQNFKSTVGIIKLIPVNDVSHGAFMQFIKFLYLDYLDMNKDNVEDLLKLSVKYGIKELENLCFKFFENDFDEHNVCVYLEKFSDNNFDGVQQICRNFIANNYLNVLESDSFLHVNENVLAFILNIDRVSDINEFSIYESIIKWAISVASKKNNNQPNVDDLRCLIGNNLKLVRFGAMTVEDFAKCQQLVPGILNSDEANAIFMNIITKTTNSLGFLDQKRISIDSQKKKSTNTFGNYGCILLPFTNAKYSMLNAFETPQKLFIELSVSKSVKLYRLRIDSHESFKLTVNIYENEIEILSENTIKKSGTFDLYITPVILYPQKRYRIQYEIKSNCKLKFDIYHSNSIEKNVVYAGTDDTEFQFKFYKMNSQIWSLNFKY